MLAKGIPTRFDWCIAFQLFIEAEVDYGIVCRLTGSRGPSSEP